MKRASLVALLLLSGCGGASITEQYVDKMRECGILGDGEFNWEYNQIILEDEEDRCFFRCMMDASCHELQADFCDLDNVLHDRCEALCIEYVPCASGGSVPQRWVCDGEPDCDDGSDEQGCPTFTCDSGEQIREGLRCDFYEDCADGSDEDGCPGGFTCADGAAIPEGWRCDGDTDCDDGSDEQACPTFTCADGTTIVESERCDFGEDCADGSDEAGCAEIIIDCNA